MLSILFHELFSALYFILTTFWLGIFIVPFLVFLVKGFVKDSYEDSLQHFSENIGLKKYALIFQTLFLTIFLYGFLIIGTMFFKNLFSDNIQRDKLEELLNKAVEEKSLYIDGKLIEEPKEIIDDLLQVESRSTHRTKDGSISSETGEKNFHITVGTDAVNLYQDNAREQEYWVYFNHYYLGQIDTYYFMSEEKINRTQRESEIKNSVLQENRDKRKIAFALLFFSLLMAFFLHQVVFDSKKVSTKRKRIIWMLFILFLGTIYFLFIDKFLLNSPFIISAILLYQLVAVSFCEKCGKMNYRKIVRLQRESCLECGDRL